MVGTYDDSINMRLGYYAKPHTLHRLKVGNGNQRFRRRRIPTSPSPAKATPIPGTTIS